MRKTEYNPSTSSASTELFDETHGIKSPIPIHICIHGDGPSQPLMRHIEHTHRSLSIISESDDKAKNKLSFHQVNYFVDQPNHQRRGIIENSHATIVLSGYPGRVDDYTQRYYTRSVHNEHLSISSDQLEDSWDPDVRQQSADKVELLLQKIIRQNRVAIYPRSNLGTLDLKTLPRLDISVSIDPSLGREYFFEEITHELIAGGDELEKMRMKVTHVSVEAQEQLQSDETEREKIGLSFTRHTNGVSQHQQKVILLVIDSSDPHNALISFDDRIRAMTKAYPTPVLKVMVVGRHAEMLASWINKVAGDSLLASYPQSENSKDTSTFELFYPAFRDIAKHAELKRAPTGKKLKAWELGDFSRRISEARLQDEKSIIISCIPSYIKAGAVIPLLKEILSDEKAYLSIVTNPNFEDWNSKQKFGDRFRKVIFNSLGGDSVILWLPSSIQFIPNTIDRQAIPRLIVDQIQSGNATYIASVAKYIEGVLNDPENDFDALDTDSITLLPVVEYSPTKIYGVVHHGIVTEIKRDIEAGREIKNLPDVLSRARYIEDIVNHEGFEAWNEKQKVFTKLTINLPAENKQLTLWLPVCAQLCEKGMFSSLALFSRTPPPDLVGKPLALWIKLSNRTYEKSLSGIIDYASKIVQQALSKPKAEFDLKEIHNFTRAGQPHSYNLKLKQSRDVRYASQPSVVDQCASRTRPGQR
jgi:hypothetical protein